jgi:hypothetical protein
LLPVLGVGEEVTELGLGLVLEVLVVGVEVVRVEVLVVEVVRVGEV